jgi:rubredoxin
MALKYQCTICGYIYDPKKGDSDARIAPNTRFEDLPEAWCCPQCGAAKEDFRELSGKGGK